MTADNHNKGKYEIIIYGKAGCVKCEALLNRVKPILEKEKYQSFSVRYYDVSTRAGLVALAKGETVNGQRIPTVQILRETERGMEKIRDPRPETYQGNRLFVPVYLQLETDYSDPARAVIKPAEIEHIMDIALAS